MESPHQQDRPDRGTVVLLHGLAANSWLMTLLSRRLQQQGFTVENWGYWSFWQSLETLIPEFEERFQTVQQRLNDEQAPLHVVGHSMGSIIARCVASQAELPSLRRLVMLSPPNGGSHFATTVGPHLKWLTSLVDELSDRPDSLVNRLPVPQKPDLQVGVIAAERDRVVREEATHLMGETDHICLPSGHSTLVLRNNVADQVLHFLEYGAFHREACTCCGETAVAEASPGG